MLCRIGLSLAALLLTSACVVGAPPGFSDGDLWQVPLIAPLENDHYLVPVSINGEGPFVFMVDPDSPESSLEVSIKRSLKLLSVQRVQRQTEEDHLLPVLITQVRKLSIGNLDIRNMNLRVHPNEAFWSGGRRVHGILGRDVLADSLAFKFDRDGGMMYIGTQGHLKAPQDAKKLSFTQNYTLPRRYLAKFTINKKHKASMHLDLGARTSMLWPALIEKFNLPKIPVNARVVDEYAMTRDINTGTIAGILEVGKDIQTNAVMMLPYADMRLEQEDLDGIIGQNFWSKYNITVNWHKKKFYLQERDADLGARAEERLARWGERLAGCEQPGCLQLDFVNRIEAQAAAPEAAEPEAAKPEATTDAAPEAPAGETVGEGEMASTPAAPPAPEPSPEGEAAAEPAASGPAAAPAATADTPPAPAPEPTQPLGLIVQRQAPGVDFAYDALFAAVDDKGELLDLPMFLASFRSGVSALSLPEIGEEYREAAGFKVLDINPVGIRECQGRQCIFRMPTPR